MRILRIALLTALVFPAVALVRQTASAADQWPQWRGPRGQGHATAIGLPVEWSETKNIAWRTEIPGRGWSSPVVADGRVWMTTAIDTPASPEEIKERLQENTGSQPVDVAAQVTLRAVCVDLSTGKLLRDVEVLTVDNPQWVHALNSYASPTPVLADGRLYSHFGDYGTACVDTANGKVLWANRQLRLMHENGPGSSPILWRDRLIVHCDGSDVQYIAALDSGTGKLAWKTVRSGKMNSNPQLKKSYGTPLVVTIDGRPQLISPAANWLYAYDPATGKELWKLEYGGLGFSIAPRPVVGHGMIYMCTSFMRSELLAVRYDGEKQDPYIAWRYKKQVPAKPSPLLVGDELYLVSDKGVATCLDAKTGAPRWEQRLGGNYSSSPMLADGRIYFSSHEGLTTVVAPGTTFRQLARNQLDGRLMASAAAVDGALLLRTDKALYRIQAEK